MARTPRPFGPDFRDGLVRRSILDAIGLPRHIQQVHVVTWAPLKATAGDRIQRATGIRARSVTVRAGNDVDALAKAGLDDGRCIAYYQSIRGGKIIAVDATGGCTLVGEWVATDDSLRTEVILHEQAVERTRP